MRRQSLPRSCALTLLRIFDSESADQVQIWVFFFKTMVLQLDESTSDPDVESAGLLRNPNDDARSSAARVRRYTPISAWCCSTPLRASLVAALFTPMIVVAVVAIADSVDPGANGRVFGHSLRRAVFGRAVVTGASSDAPARSAELVEIRSELLETKVRMQGIVAQRGPPRPAMHLGEAPFVCAVSEGALCACNGTIVFGRKFRDEAQTVVVAALREMEDVGATKSIATRVPAGRDGLACQPSSFGGDPVYGYHSHCFCVPLNFRYEKGVTVESAPDAPQSGATLPSPPPSAPPSAPSPASAPASPPAADVICAASEGDLCFCAGGTATYGRKFVTGRAGPVTSFTEMTASAEKVKTTHVATFVQCKPEAFGGDPVYGLHGHCYCSGGQPSDSDVPTSVVAWSAPSVGAGGAATAKIALLSAAEHPLSPRFASAFPPASRFTSCDQAKAPASSACVFALFAARRGAAADHQQCALSRQLLPVIHCPSRMLSGVRMPLSVRVFDAAGELSPLTAAATLSVGCVRGGEGGTTTALLDNVAWWFDGSRVRTVPSAEHIELNIYRGVGFGSVLLTPAALAAVGGVCTHLDVAVHITAMDGRHLFVERRVELLARPE